MSPALADIHTVQVGDNGGAIDEGDPALAPRAHSALLFQTEMNALRRWIEDSRESGAKFGEWEAYYPRWVEVYDAIRRLIAAHPAATWTPHQVRDVVYAMARDSEDQMIAESIGEHTGTLFAITEAAIVSDEPDSRWQLAVELGKVTSHRVEAISLLLRLADDSNEYVRRMVLVSLGELRADDAQRLAERAWSSGLLYQRMVAQSVLGTIGSRELPRYVRLAEEDGRRKRVCPPSRQALDGDGSRARG